MRFTLRQLFSATAYTASGFALTAAVIPIWQSARAPMDPLPGLFVFFSPFAIAALFGAGVGVLLGNVKEWAKIGMVVAVALYVPVMIVSFMLAT